MRDGGESRPRRPGQVAHRAALEVRAALRPFTIPNGITLIRFALTPFFVLAVMEKDSRLALVIFVAAGITDALDGLLARVLKSRSLLGSYLDPIADKTLLVAAYISLTWMQDGVAVTIPRWLTILALSRDFLILLVALILYLGAGLKSFPPSVWGKMTTVIHIITVAVVLIANGWWLPEMIPLSCFYLALSLTIVSGVDYIRLAGKRLEVLHDGENS